MFVLFGKELTALGLKQMILNDVVKFLPYFSERSSEPYSEKKTKKKEQGGEDKKLSETELESEVPDENSSVEGSPFSPIELLRKLTAVFLMVYTVYTLFSLVAWVSHLGSRVTILQKFLVANGFASNKPVKNVYELFKYNTLTSLLFILPHSFLRPPTLQRYIGFRFARLVYCAIAGLSLHILLVFFRPINFNVKYQTCMEETSADPIYCNEYVYNEEDNVPLFTLPVPKFTHDILSVSMLIFAFYCVLIDYRTYIILGFNRAFFGAGSKYDRFPKDLSPRMDIITWMGYCVWLMAGNAGFVLFSGLSILPYKVYTWDIIVRVVAASYLRIRSQGFRIWVGKIESTHHFIWILRALIVLVAVGSQFFIFANNDDNSSGQGGTVGMFKSFDWKTILMISTAGVGVAVFLDRLEKLK